MKSGLRWIGIPALAAMVALSGGCGAFFRAKSSAGTPEQTAAPAAKAVASETPEENKSEENRVAQSVKTEKAMFGAGCFWGVELTFQTLDGVIDTDVGYAGGGVERPTYKEVCTDRTGHAEVVLVEYDPSKISYEKLLEVFWKAHDPTQVNRQGPDYGTQYRSAIFYYTPEQREIATRSREAAQERFPRKIATEITEAAPFWPAEEYHQDYLKKRGQTSCSVGGH